MATRHATIDKKLDTIMEKLANLEGIPTQLADIQSEFKTLKSAMVEINESVEFMEKEVVELKEVMKCKATREEFEGLGSKLASFEESTQKRLDDLENRSRRQNLIIFGVSESNNESCETIVKEDILHGLMGFTNINLERVHRTPGGPRNPSQEKPRPIHVRFRDLSDRDKILQAAPGKLKDTPYRGAKIFISDDVCPAIRNARKALRAKLPEVRQGAGVRYASVQACIVMVKTDGSRHKIYK